MVVEMSFEFRFTATIVMSGCTVRLQCSFVYNGAFAAFSFQRTVGFISTITWWCGTVGVGSVLKHNFVVLGYDSSHVGHAAVAHFDDIFIAYSMYVMVMGNELRPVLEIPFRFCFLHSHYRME